MNTYIHLLANTLHPEEYNRWLYLRSLPFKESVTPLWVSAYFSHHSKDTSCELLRYLHSCGVLGKT